MRKFDSEARAQAYIVCNYGLPFSTAPRGEGKSRLGGELRREEQRLSRTGERVDRDGTVDGMCEGVFACLSPLAPARPESHNSKGQVGPSRRAPTDQLG
jgi:hypothetical protein